jgi:hypothetical protein
MDTILYQSVFNSPIAFLATMAGVKLINWTQDGSPVIATPLTLGAKPMCGITFGRRPGLLLGLAGKWYQYKEDLSDTWRKLDIAEEVFDTTVDFKESVVGWLSGAEN